MQDPVKRIDDLERQYQELKGEMNANLTMVIGQGWKTEENLRLLRTSVNGRFDRIDGQITELNRDVAELELAVKDIKTDIVTIKTAQDEHGKKLDLIIARLPQPPNP